MYHLASHRNLNEDRPDLLARRSLQLLVPKLYARPDSSCRYLLQYRMLWRRTKRTSLHRQGGKGLLSPLCYRPKVMTRKMFEVLHQRQHNNHNLTRANRWHKLRPSKRSWSHHCLSSHANPNKASPPPLSPKQPPQAQHSTHSTSPFPACKHNPHRTPPSSAPPPAALNPQPHRCDPLHPPR